MKFGFNSTMGGGLTGVRRRGFRPITAIFLLVFGAIFLGASGLIFSSMRIDPSWIKIDGTISSVATRRNSDNEIMYSPTVRYTVNGRSYEVTAGSSSTSYPTVGNKRQIAYNPQQPAQAKVVETGGSKALAAIFPLIGIAVLLSVPIAFIRARRRNAAIDRLVSSGIKLQGIVTDVKMGNSDTQNSNTGYAIEVSAVDTSGNTQVFTSDQLTGLGGLGLMNFRTTPVPVDVYVDPTNPNNYYVDISDIPNLTPDRVAQLVKQASQQQTVAGFEPNQTVGQQSPLTNPASPTDKV